MNDLFFMKNNTSSASASEGIIYDEILGKISLQFVVIVKRQGAKKNPEIPPNYKAVFLFLFY